MVILKTSARIKCEKCNATNLDPFAVGPSSHKIRIRDTYKGHEVSFFAIKKTEEIPDLELNTNRLEFEKWIRLQKS